MTAIMSRCYRTLPVGGNIVFLYLIEFEGGQNFDERQE